MARDEDGRDREGLGQAAGGRARRFAVSARNDTTFISFGHRCSTAALLDRCGLGAEALPFDSIVCQLGVVRDCLESEFEAFLNPSHYVKVRTRTVNIVDGVVEPVCEEDPSVNWHYEQGQRDLTGRSTYHLKLALTHHDLTRAEDHATYARRVRRLLGILEDPRRKVGVYVHPLMGMEEFERQEKDGLLEDFRAFGRFLAARYRNISVLFFVLVKVRSAVASHALLFEDDLCRVHVIYANQDFVDAQAPFAGKCAQEIETMMALVEQAKPGPKYKIYFPLFDHIEASSNEVRLTHEGLLAHPRVELVDEPERADYVILCQNHLVDHNPLHRQFRPLAERYKERTILLDYDDSPEMIYSADDFRWRLYFKRSCVDRTHGRVMDYGGLAVRPTAYCVIDEMCAPPADDDGRRSIDVACLFDDQVIDSPWFALARGRLLRFAKRLAERGDLRLQVGTVSECGPVGRAGIHPDYKRCLFDSKIVLHANPDPWEGDARLWEALAAGALVFVDRMHVRLEQPLVDGQHLVYYDLTDEGMAKLETQIRHYLAHDEERERIGRAGRAFVLAHHRSVDRVDQIIRALEEPPHRPPAIEVSSNLDVVVSVATGYQDVEAYRPFIATLRRTGATCPVLLGISEGPEYEPVRRYLLDNAINCFTVPPVSPAGKICHGLRFAEYARWLRDLPFRYALMLDFRDAYFQRDPFQDVDRHMRDCDLYLMSEFQLLTVGNHPNRLNYAWVAEPFGDAVADAIADRPILNSGAILGRKGAVLALAESIAEITSAQDFAFADQGTLNYLGHTGRLRGCGRVKTVRAGESLVNNCGFTEIDRLREERGLTAEEEARIAWIPRDARGRLALPRDHQGWVLDDDGNVSSVVHQYDRFPEMDELVWRLSRYDGPDDVFVNGGDRAYRGERYTLSSRQGLRPDAVPRLIARLKALPTTPKPLLLLDARFRRGFVFAHGILNIELLYEAEALRRAFFTAAPDERRCVTFCRKWGYEPMFVDEHELFATGEPAPPATEIAQGFREARAQAERWSLP